MECFWLDVDRAANDSYANCPRGNKEAEYTQTSSRSYGDASGYSNDLSKLSSSRYTPYEITSRGTNDQVLRQNHTNSLTSSS